MKKLAVDLRYVYILLALIFIVQAFTSLHIINVYFVLNYFGLANNIFDIVISVFYIAGFFVLLDALLTVSNKINIVKGRTKNKILLNIVVEFIKFFIIFFPAWITFSFLNGGLDLTNLNGNMETFLNIYLSWFFIIKIFFRPEIAPDFGLTREEKDGVV